MRVLIADNQSIVRHALRLLLEQAGEAQVVGDASQVQNLLAQAEESTPDLVLLGANLPGLNLVELLPALRRANPEVKVIVLSTHPEVSSAALASGADGFLSKTETPERLLEMIIKVTEAKED